VNDKKIIGTFVPIESLISSNLARSDQGTFEAGLYFLDWLKATGQSAWQFLPIHETELKPGSKNSRVASPYKSYGVGLNPKFASSKYSSLRPTSAQREIFIRENKKWIDDYVLFVVLSKKLGTDDWRKWPKGLKERENEALDKAQKDLIYEIDEEVLSQWRLHKSYEELRQKAKELKIQLIGDLPFYVPIESPLVWMFQDIFQIDHGKMKFVSGVPNYPNTYFGRQIWGHPLYNWNFEKYKDQIEKYWHLRFSYLAKLFDTVRFDHAKAFFNYGMMSLANPAKDHFAKGPGFSFFKEIVEFCRRRHLDVFAEDSGENREELEKAQNKLGVAGISVFRYGFNEKTKKMNKEYSQVNKYLKNLVAYTTTHDTETLIGYLRRLTPSQKKELMKVSEIPYSSDDKKQVENIRNAVIASPAFCVLIPIQDWILDDERINVPGTENAEDDPNWHYKIPMPIEKLPVKNP